MKRRHGSALLVLLAATASTPVPAAERKAVVFAMEGVDLPADARTKERLAAATRLLREQVATRGLAVVDTAPQAAKIEANLPLHECNGCDADIAAALGADVEVATAVRASTPTLFDLSGTIKAVRDGRVLRQGTVSVQGENADEWAHAVKFLVRERLLPSPLPQDAADGGR